MPLMMRRAAFRTWLATAGTLASVLLARKLWPAASDGRPWSGPPGTGAPAAAPSPPVLREVAASLVAVTPRVALPRFPVTTVAPDGRLSTGPVADAFGRRGTVLNLWATWCGPCRREMASLARLAVAVHDDGIAVLPVSIDRGGLDAVRAFYRDDGLAALRILVDPEDAAGQALALGAIPVTFVLDRAGRIAARLDGGADWATAGAIEAIRRLV